MALDGFAPFISAQLRCLIAHFPHVVKLEQARSGSNYFPASHDRFTLFIPYCLEFIKWDVVYNAEFPQAPPDIVFGPEDEDFSRFLISGGEGGDSRLANTSLSDWNNKDPTRLLTLIRELRDIYTSYQRKRVGEVDDERLKFEMSTILSREGIEVHMTSGVEKPEEVKFAVPLMDMDINKMVPACPWRHSQKIFLQVVFPVSRKYPSTPSAPRLKLMSTAELRVLFSIDDFRLPTWVDGMCMAEYLPHLEDLLQRQVMEAVSSIDARRHFIEALAPLFGRPLEADPVFCRKATFLVVSGAFTFMVNGIPGVVAYLGLWSIGKKFESSLLMVYFFLSTQFPKQQPSLRLQSNQHYNSRGTPIKSTLITEYPWSPRWEAPQMAERIFDFLADESVNFKRFCSEAQGQQ